MDHRKKAPALIVNQWLNADEPIDLDSLIGKVVVIEAFQMLCPGCVAHGIPQAQRIHDYFPKTDVAVLGLHTVFEHHKAMTPAVLAAFLYENRVRFPVGIDEPNEPNGTEIPKTMQAYAMQGTPTLIIIDRQGRLRHQSFGATNDLAIGAQIGAQISELVRGA